MLLTLMAESLSYGKRLRAQRIQHRRIETESQHPRSDRLHVDLESPDTLTPASRRLRATVEAMSGAPGVSPWMQMVWALSLTSVPSWATTTPRWVMLRACWAASAGSRISASSNLRERKVPSGS